MPYYEVSNVCLNCHTDGKGTAPIMANPPPGVDGTTEGLFLPGDASNVGGNNPDLKDYETSHNWYSPTDTRPEFGASAPVRNAENRFFYSRYGTSTGKITCSRCHLPHAYTDNPQLLVMGPDSADKMCQACHSAWLLDEHGWLTHPIIDNYNASVAEYPDKYRSPLINKDQADIKLVDGGVSCTSCHGVHFVDSDSSTVDGPGKEVSKSDGKLLRGDGPDRADKSSLCQTCHTYLEHGKDAGERVGCLVCHSGHSYDPALPNYYVLRKGAKTTTYNAVTGLDYSSTGVLDADLKYKSMNDWNDGTADGYCEKCHGDAVTIGWGAGKYHVESAICTDCHKHDNGLGSFTHGAGSGGIGCEHCHAPDHVVKSDQANWVIIFDNTAGHSSEITSNDPGPIDAYATCSLCHKTNLLTQHANDCNMCHTGSLPPAESFGGASWNQTCQQGSCHPSYHPGASDSHDTEYYNGKCNSCHNPGDFYVYWTWDDSLPGFVATATDCGRCHTMGVDNTAPVSYSDLQPAYFGTAVINLWATDARAIKTTYYRLDRGVVTATSVPIMVEPPANGTQAHTLEYWSVDWSGNNETPHKTGNFTVSMDTTPPVTTSDAKAEYGGAATILLSPTDDATSYGVAATYYRFDNDPVTTGTTAVMPEPASGSETHTLYFWSVDHVGNVEAEKSATFTIYKDEVAPSTTTDLLTLPHYYSRANLRSEAYLDITLTSSDPAPGSGVAGVRVTSSVSSLIFDPNNNEASWNGSSWDISVSFYARADGDYPISYSARDNSGNIEAVKTTTITVDRGRPITSSDAVAEYSGTATITLTPTDSFSGVSATYYTVDGGAQQTGTTVVVVPPVSGSTSHTLRFWSVDIAGNVESNRYEPFTVWEEGTDIAPPTGSISINSGNTWTNTLATTLTLSASDPDGSVAEMRFSNDDTTWSSWETYATSKNWTLSAGSGTMTVYVQFKDAAGHISSSYGDTIGLETIAPVTTSNAVSGTTYFSDNFSGVKTFTLTPTDSGGSGVASTWWQLDGTGGIWTSGTSVAVPAPLSGTAAHTIYWYSRDNATNQETQKTVTITMEAGGLEHTGVVRNVAAWLGADPYLLSLGTAWATYTIKLDGVVIGSKAANATTTWTLTNPVEITGAGIIEIVVTAGFTDPDTLVWDDNVPVTYTITLPGGASRLEAATWSGFSNKIVGVAYDEDYDDDLATNVVPAGMIENIVYVTTMPDITDPVTTSTAVSGTVYAGTQTFTLTPTDLGGSGVESTKWQPDSISGTWTIGTQVEVLPPASGTKSHTIYWYSQDHAGNQEAIKSVSFSVEKISPPSVSLPLTETVWYDSEVGASGPWVNFKVYLDGVLLTTAGGFNAGVTFAGNPSTQFSNWPCPETAITGSGRIDIHVTTGFTNPGTFYGESGEKIFTTTLPAGAQRLEADTWKIPYLAWDPNAYDEEWGDYYSTVYMPAGKSISNISYAPTGADITAPATTCDAVSAATYVGDQAFTLTPTDSESGVQSTWWQLDGSGFWTIGTSVPVAAPASGTASRTITWYSRDNATNQETQQSVTFDVQATGGG